MASSASYTLLADVSTNLVRSLDYRSTRVCNDANIGIGIGDTGIDIGINQSAGTDTDLRYRRYDDTEKRW